MKIQPRDLPAIVGEYMDAHVCPQATGMQKFGAYSLLYVMGRNIDSFVAAYTPVMRMSGIMDENGLIDLDYVKGMADAGMDKAKKVNVLGFNMDVSDIDAIYAIAQRHSR